MILHAVVLCKSLIKILKSPSRGSAPQSPQWWHSPLAPSHDCLLASILPFSIIDCFNVHLGNLYYNPSCKIFLKPSGHPDRFMLSSLIVISLAMGTNWSTGSSVWTWGRTSSLWGRRSTGTGCPGRLWSLLLWRYSRPAWTRSCAACSGWPCLGRGVGLDDPQRSLPTPTILWFCEHVFSRRQNYAHAIGDAEYVLKKRTKAYTF